MDSGEQGHSTLVPDHWGNGVGGHRDGGHEVLSGSGQVQRQSYLFQAFLAFGLTPVNPPQQDGGQLRGELATQLDALLIAIILGTLNGETLDDEAQAIVDS